MIYKTENKLTKLNSDKFIYELNVLSKITTGINNPIIKFEYTGTYSCKSRFYNETYNNIDKNPYKVLRLSYKLSYIKSCLCQYNDTKISENFKPLGFFGDWKGNNIAEKLIELLKIIDDQLFEDCEKIIAFNNQIKETEETAKKDLEAPRFFYSPVVYYNKLNKKTMTKINKLNNIHKKLLSKFSTDEIVNHLKILIKAWELDNFKIVEDEKYRPYVEGSFLNADVPSFNSEIKENKNDL